MTRGRPPGIAGRTIAPGAPILHEGPGRSDHRRPGYCDSCSVPATSTRLLTFELRLYGKRAGEWTLCQPCYEWRNRRPFDPDPLHVDESAA